MTKMEEMVAKYGDIELSVLACMAKSDKAALEVLTRFEKIENPFYLKKNELLYSVIKHLYIKGVTRDVVAIADACRSMQVLEKIGGFQYIFELGNHIVSATNAKYYADVLHGMWLQREVVNAAQELQKAAEGGEMVGEELLEHAQREYDSIGQKAKGVEDLTPQQVADETYNYVKLVRENKIRNLTSYYDGFNLITGGYQEGDYIVIAARPSIGKTAYTLSELRHLSYRKNIPTAFISLDSKRRNIMFRLFAMETGLNIKNLRMGYLNETQLEWLKEAKDKHAKGKLYVDDTALKVGEIRNRLKSLKMRKDIQLVVVDYLQIVETSSRGNKTREREIGEISAELKRMAKDLNLVVVALSQLSRGVEMRSDKRPILSDLRDSGSIEQDADIVVMLHRPEYYGIEYFDSFKQQPTAGRAEAIIAKGRDVGCGTYRLNFEHKQAHFSNEQMPTWQDVEEENEKPPF